MLPAPGQELNLGTWVIDRKFVEGYLGAIEDDSPIYGELGVVPPLALAARAMGALLEALRLPPGTLHAAQELDCKRTVVLGEEVVCVAKLSRPISRGEWQFISAEFSLNGKDGDVLLGGKSTVLVPAGKRGVDSPMPSSSLPMVERIITQERLVRYAEASGDYNPLHLEPEFAAGTQFGAIIAHGMLTLAFISQMLTLAFGRDWLEGGRLKVRFKAPAYLGDSVRTSGRSSKRSRQMDAKGWNAPLP